MSASWEALAAIGRSLVSNKDRPQIQNDVVDIVRSGVGCDAIALMRLNPLTGCHETVVSSEYPNSVLHHLNTWFVGHDEVYTHMRTIDQRPLRWKDMPFEYTSMFSAERVFIPAGFREGVTVCLYNESRQYTGALHVSSGSRDHPDDDAMRLLYASQTIVGSLVDWWKFAAKENYSGDEDLRVVVDLSGAPHLHPDTPARLRHIFDTKIAPRIPRDLTHVPSFSYLNSGEATYAVRARRRAESVNLDIRPGPLPCGITPRELDVATLLVAGLTNSQMAEHLAISPKTAARHVENIEQKLDRPTRTGAAVRAAELGLCNLQLSAPVQSPHYI